MNQETISGVNVNYQKMVKPVVTEIPIDPENCPFATRHTWDNGCFVYHCTLDINHHCAICNEGKDCDKLYALNK